MLNLLCCTGLKGALMRIAPVMLKISNNNAISTKGQSFNRQKTQSVRHYTGNPCQDLAYASMFDKKIAQDLKLMGLI